MHPRAAFGARRASHGGQENLQQYSYRTGDQIEKRIPQSPDAALDIVAKDGEK